MQTKLVCHELALFVELAPNSSPAFHLSRANHLLCGDMWQSVNLDHPATFDTLAMDLDAKKGTWRM
ncbi:AAA-ATPase [Senna tora]|uniref:AAA-ATPase n=1 Tax=Senna tora TaxID=362788 RepID=A0A834U024_9FABA|nr:AAA-ATPase [Senna tora]